VAAKAKTVPSASESIPAKPRSPLLTTLDVDGRPSDDAYRTTVSRRASAVPPASRRST
jgi:hypothetical protein